MRRVHAIVTGDVQGVGYRYSMRRIADESGIAGWVRNRRDGSVEAELEGTPEQIDAVLAWMRRGPQYASPAEVQVAEVPPTGRLGFEIRATA